MKITKDQMLQIVNRDDEFEIELTNGMSTLDFSFKQSEGVRIKEQAGTTEQLDKIKTDYGHSTIEYINEETFDSIELKYYKKR